MCFVRHGERCDNVDYPDQLARIELPWDPPLTHEGEAQARLTGDHLKKVIKEHKYKFIVIEASPWIRTLQTAAAIAQQIGVPQIRVNYNYSEWMKGKFFPEGNPIGKLYVETLPIELIRERFLDGIDLDMSVFSDTRKTVANRFPEGYSDTAYRVNNAIIDLRKNYKYTDLRIAHIVVTHGANVSTFSTHFAREAMCRISS